MSSVLQERCGQAEKHLIEAQLRLADASTITAISIHHKFTYPKSILGQKVGEAYQFLKETQLSSFAALKGAPQTPEFLAALEKAECSIATVTSNLNAALSQPTYSCPPSALQAVGDAVRLLIMLGSIIKQMKGVC
jgi:hypothetical protein